MLSFFENPRDNQAYMQGFVAGRKANGEDWVRSELEKGEETAAKEQAWQNELRIAYKALEIIEEKDRRIENLQSELLAARMALRAYVNDDIERGKRV